MQQGDILKTTRHEYPVTVESVDGEAITATHIDKWRRLCKDTYAPGDFVQPEGEPTAEPAETETETTEKAPEQ